jgi:uncharacterized membrane protein
MGLWLAGGVSLGGRLWLKHGADPRRAALLVGLALMTVPLLRKRSWVARGVFRAVEELERNRGLRWALLFFALIWACVLGGLQTLALRYPLWDVGIFHQILWNLSHGNGFGSSLSGAGDFLRDHLSVSLAALVPGFDLAEGSPVYLPITHALLVYGGVAAWLFLAERAAPGKSWVPASVAVFGLGFDSLWANLRWGFHESALAFFGLSWCYALIFSVKGSRIGRFPGARAKEEAVLVLALALALFAAGAKETMLLEVCLLLGIWSAFAYQSRRWAWSGLLLGLGISLFIGFIYFEQMPHPAGKNYFDRYYSYLGHGLPEFASNLVFHPLRVVEAIGFWSLVKYVFTVFGPWLFLPWFSSRRVWLLAIAPSFMSAAIATYPPLRQASFHYVLELWPLLASLTILTLARLDSRRLAWAWAFLALLLMDQDPWGQLREYATDAARARPARLALSAIPSELSLMSDELGGPWVAGRAMLSRWPDLAPFGGSCPERLLLPLGGRELGAYPQAERVLARCRFGPEWAAGDWVLFRRLPQPQ